MERKVRSGRKRRTVFVESLLRRLPWKLIELYQLQTEKAIRELRADTHLRVGRMCKKPTPRNGDAMMIEWLAQPDGTPYVGMIVTSTVIGFKTEDRGKYIEVTTRNSIYTFERV